MSNERIKELVREKYSQIAGQDKAANASSCCGSGQCSTEVYNIMTEDYSEVEGYQEQADLGLGCGLPTQYAGIEAGDTVLDLGSGAGNDAFIARHEVGAQGKIIGVDFSEQMIEKARRNAEKLGYNNVEFRHGDIESLPVSDVSVDVVISNCVLNLVPDKGQVFREINRVLKPGGHFSISDVVLLGELPEAIRRDVEMYAGCISGAVHIDEYLGYIEAAGFREPRIVKIRAIQLPDDILSRYLSPREIEAFRDGDDGICSITVFARRPWEGEEEIGARVEQVKGLDAREICCGGGGCGC